MTEYTCPVEGCDYGQNSEKSKAAVRSHINASSGEQHDWDALKDALDAQDDIDDADQADQQPDDTDTDDMPTDTEYDQQHSQAKGTDDSGTDEPDPTSSSDSFLPKMSTQTMVMLVGFVVLCVLLYTYLNKDDDQQPVEQPDEQDDQPAKQAATSGGQGIIE